MSGIVPGAGRTFLCLAEFCGRSEQMTLMWLVGNCHEKACGRGNPGLESERSGASPAAGSGHGGAGLGEDGWAASGETHSLFGSWWAVGGGGTSRRRTEKYSWYSEYLGVGVGKGCDCLHVRLQMAQFHSFFFVRVVFQGFPGASAVKNPLANAGDAGSIPGWIPGVGKIPWRRKWQPTPVFLPGESHG